MQGTLEMIDHTGDTKMTWDSDSPEEIKAAKRTFDDLKKKNYLAYKVNKKGDKGEAIDEFDPDAERIIMSPAMAGGA